MVSLRIEPVVKSDDEGTSVKATSKEPVEGDKSDEEGGGEGHERRRRRKGSNSSSDSEDDGKYADAVEGQ